MQTNKQLVQQALHKGLFHTRPRTQSLGDVSNLQNSTQEQQNSSVKNGKRTRSPRECYTKPPHKQAKVDNYWLSNPIQLSNSFTGLDTEPEPAQLEGEKQQSQHAVKEPRPPPIFVDRVGNIQPLIDLLNEHAKDNYLIKVLRNDQVKIQPKSGEHYKNIVNQLELKGTEFHTYKPKQDRTYKVVLKNIHPSTDTDDIKQALGELGHTATNIWNIKARSTNKPLPIFFIELQPCSNNKDIYNLKYLLHCQVKIEEQIPKRVIPQCANCQQYGHTKTYCRRQPKCIKCAGEHMSVDCPRKTRSNDVKCILCEGNHPANYKGCTVYKELQKIKYPSLRPKTIPGNKAIKAPGNLLPKPQIYSNLLPKPQTYSYSDAAKATQKSDEIYQDNLNPNTPPNPTKPDEMKMLMSMMQQMMQQLTTVTNLLLSITSRLPNSIQLN